MPNTLSLISPRLLSLFVVCLLAGYSFASSPAYRQDFIVAPSGKPLLQITNSSGSSIVAFAVVEFPSSGIEGHFFYDAYTTPQRDRPIAPGGSTIVPLGYFHGSDVSKVRSEVRAVIFEDGSRVGDPAWINAVFARRVRLYDRLLSLHDLLRRQVGAGLSQEVILDKLRTAQAEADRQLPSDELRAVDDLAFYAAISTLQAAQASHLDLVVEGYLKHLEKRAVLLESAQPGLDAIRALPTAMPAPLAEFRDPEQFSTRGSSSRRVRSAKNISPSPNVAAGAAVVKSETAPTITSLSPTSAAVGQEVTITGSNFGKVQGEATITFNGTKSTPTSWNTDGEQIVAPVPSGASTGPVVVTLEGDAASNGVTFTVLNTCTGQSASSEVSGIGCGWNGSEPVPGEGTSGPYTVSYELTENFTYYNGATGKSSTSTYDGGDQWEQVGQCWAAYTNCSGTTANAGAAPNPAPLPIAYNSGAPVTTSSYTGEFYWTLFNYQTPEWDQCPTGSGCPTCPTGQTCYESPQPINDPTYSYYWYYNNACAVKEE